MCPHECDIDSHEHKQGCVWAHNWTPAGSRMQAVPRRETETK